ncbi:MAG: nitroreductase/quinone reductase family protein, partial [Candidatus Dormibacteria bacterium]
MTANDYNQKTIDEFHAKQGLGVGPWGDNLVLLTTRSATSGGEITTPLLYRRHDGGYVVVASRGGAPTHPKWYESILVNPEVRVEVAADGEIEQFHARARV